MLDQNPFWRSKTLNEMNNEEWERLCDGCAQCCQIRFEDSASNKIVTAPLACRLLDLDSCQCMHYQQRHHLVKDCIELTPNNIGDLAWLPETCAYRLVHEGKDLFDWHPLISGNRQKMDDLGISVKHRVVSEQDVHVEDLTENLIKWVR